jgi:hypothetical protein
MANLKKSPSNGKLTPQQEKEYIKCAGDCFYFINNYCRIIAGNQGIKPLALFDYQTELLQNLLDYRFNVILKARQLGITTIAAAYCLWICMFQGFKDIGAVADKEPTILEMMRRFKMMYDYLPDWLKDFVPTTRNNETTVEFATGSRITCTTTTDKSLAGRTLYMLVMDEAALIDIAEDLWTVAYPTLNLSGRAMVMSSPRGISTWFYDIYTKAEMGENAFKPTKLMWYVRPEYTQEWFEDTTRNLTPRKIAQEFCCDFLGSSETVLDSDTIDKLEKRVIEPISKEGPGKALWIWEEVKKRNQYLLVCDTARGDSTDYTAAHVIDLGSLHQVAEFKCKIPIDEAAVFLFELGRRYNNALLVVENNTLGYMAANTLQRMNYPNLHYSKRNAPLYEDPVEAAYYDPDQIVPGFHTTQQNRPAIVTQMELYLRRGTLKDSGIKNFYL